MSPRMNPQPTDRLYFDLQLAYARPVIALLAILCLLELRTARQAERPLSFLIAYLFLAVIIPLCSSLSSVFVPWSPMLFFLSWLVLV